MRQARVSVTIFQTYHARWIVAPALLTMVLGLAWMLQRGMMKDGLLAPMGWLGRYECFHIAAHFCIFGGLALLLGPQRRHDRHGSLVLVWFYTLAGGILIEVIQFVAGGDPLSRALLAGSLFDLGVDALGALAGLEAMRRYTLGKAND